MKKNNKKSMNNNLTKTLEQEQIDYLYHLIINRNRDVVDRDNYDDDREKYNGYNLPCR
mgnify:CR=1 FL=1